MTYVYIDESGDLGMSNKGSEYLILTAVKIEDDQTNIIYKRIPKNIRQKTLKKKVKKMAELKFSNSSVLIRERFLTRIAQLDVEVYSRIIKKEFTKDSLKNNLPILYNYLIKILLEKVLSDINKNKRLEIHLDKCMSSSQRENFESYVKTEFLYLFSVLPNVTIVHESSQCNEALQVSDFVCGAFGYKYNTAKLKENCNHYTGLISNKIKIEKNDLFRK
ncbi:DUF3800 domain-containing protein [Candidatus Woesearchaeota archaeon]|nr:DUF3800 domain-containing protein [Candidatus Woesearchaeota archaeon]